MPLLKPYDFSNHRRPDNRKTVRIKLTMHQCISSLSIPFKRLSLKNAWSNRCAIPKIERRAGVTASKSNTTRRHPKYLKEDSLKRGVQTDTGESKKRHITRGRNGGEQLEVFEARYTRGSYDYRAIRGVYHS